MSCKSVLLIPVMCENIKWLVEHSETSTFSFFDHDYSRNKYTEFQKSFQINYRLGPTARFRRNRVACSPLENNRTLIVCCFYALESYFFFVIIIFFFPFKSYAAQRVVWLLLYRNGASARQNVSNDRANNAENRESRRFRTFRDYKVGCNFLFLFAVNFRLSLSS